MSDATVYKHFRSVSNIKYLYSQLSHVATLEDIRTRVISDIRLPQILEDCDSATSLANISTLWDRVKRLNSLFIKQYHKNIL